MESSAAPATAAARSAAAAATGASGATHLLGQCRRGKYNNRQQENRELCKETVQVGRPAASVTAAVSTLPPAAAIAITLATRTTHAPRVIPFPAERKNILAMSPNGHGRANVPESGD